MFSVKIDDSQVKKFVKESPRRADWALREALSMAGGHYRKDLRKSIEQGKIGGPKGLHPLTKGKRKNRRSPLYALGKLVRFKVSRIKKTNFRLWFGFLGGGKRYFRQKLTSLQVAKIHEGGKRIRVTPAMRRKAAAMGHPIKKSTRFIQIPARPMIEPFWQKIKAGLPGYVEKRFFQKFFSKENPRLGI
jgi:hypothetical protein